MTSQYSLERAAQAWCTDKTSGIVMDPILAEAFADILDSERKDLEKLRVQLADCNTEARTFRLKYEKIINWDGKA